VLTIVLSFVAFNKPFSVHYLAPGALVTVGILLSTAVKQEQRVARHESLLLLAGLITVPFLLQPYMFPDALPASQ
jgi:hypothetical protein